MAGTVETKRSKALGMVVVGVLTLTAPLQVAAQSKIELEGSITRVTGRTIELFAGLLSIEARGAKIETDDENFTNISDLKPGTSIEVSPVTGEDGLIQAHLIEVNDEKEADPEVGGVISSVDEAGQTFAIGPVTVSWDSQTKFKGMSRPQAGVLVEAEIDVVGSRLVAKAVEREEDDD